MFRISSNTTIPNNTPRASTTGNMFRLAANDLEELARVELMPKLDGKKMNMILAPKSKK